MKLDSLLVADTINCACARYGLTPLSARFYDSFEAARVWHRVHQAITALQEADTIPDLLPWQHAYIVGMMIHARMIFHGNRVGKTTAQDAGAAVVEWMIERFGTSGPK